jgi:hypothetical protein
MNKALEEQIHETFAYIEAWCEFMRRLEAVQPSDPAFIAALEGNLGSVLVAVIDLAKSVEQSNFLTEEVHHETPTH